MRLHHLEVVAFGPFAEPVEVDFDALSGAGLFLLTGATGAGKTSVLDAVCFALYGAVPGDRQGAKRLRSDHAAPGAVPSVTLELSVAGRRFRVLRSPAWHRPRKRGEGTTREQARVLLCERLDGAWIPRATRLDEAGHLVSELLGMTLTQFCQVQLLPQGRFQAFLRAESDERHRLLQRLFRTSRFEDVEQWLRDRRRSLRHEADRRHHSAAEVVSRISEAAGRELPEGWDPHDLRPVAGEIAPWAAQVGVESTAATTEASRVVAARRQSEAASRQRLEAGRTIAERQQRRARADARAAALAAGRRGHEARVAVLASARRATGVLPLWHEVGRARREADAAEDQTSRALAAVRDLVGRPDCGVDTLAATGHGATTAAARARAREPHVAELAALEQSLEASSDRSDEVADRLTALDERATALPAEVEQARAAESAATRASDAIPAARQEATMAAERLDAARLVARLVLDKAAAETRHHASIDTAQERRELWLRIQEQRLEGMAAEIAGALAVGGSCPVCGSAHHPQPARPAAGAPDAASERAARRSVDDAESERHARSLAVHDLQTRLDVAREHSGHRGVPDLERVHAAATSALARLRAEAETLAATVHDRKTRETELGGLFEQRSGLRSEAARLDATGVDLGRRVARLTTELAELLAGTGHDTVSGLAGHLDTVAARCREAVAAAADLERARSLARQALARATSGSAEQGFVDEGSVRAVALPGLLLERLERDVRDHEAALSAVTEALADPELEATAAAEPPDLETLTRHHARDHDALAAARATASVCERREARLRRLVADLDTALTAWAPVRAELEVADRMAGLADGTSADNRLRMRLSAYVLTSRLSRVVDAANERLARMFDHRYALEHSGDRGVGESRGGLSLRVRDDWTGESRDPVTLSGGETFVVSLALALGLADVIAHEAGGSELDTLFVDEGFGSLDAETLDQVLDTLDSLRDGGRVVGVVSHVAEMRDRIPTQLHVRKRRVGSTLSQR